MKGTWKFIPEGVPVLHTSLHVTRTLFLPKTKVETVSHKLIEPV